VVVVIVAAFTPPQNKIPNTAATKPTFRFGTKTGDKICRNQGFLIVNLCQGKTSHWIRHMFFVSMPRIITLCAISGKVFFTPKFEH